MTSWMIETCRRRDLQPPPHIVTSFHADGRVSLQRPKQPRRRAHKRNYIAELPELQPTLGMSTNDGESEAEALLKAILRKSSLESGSEAQPGLVTDTRRDNDMEDQRENDVHSGMLRCQETNQERLDRWKIYFNNRPLRRCLDRAGDDEESPNLFAMLFQDVQVDAAWYGDLQCRSILQVRAWCQKVRTILMIPDNEIYFDWPYVEHGDVGDIRPRKFRHGSKYVSRWWKADSTDSARHM
ncbi:hypothetical protein BJ875DRAFT_489446 [Amylocarpus encephaloides]|uniref:Uncharacterized protein n=1 Tax=Amylocarpus encephaloides TaxID=45428 RepID=A0A9P7Y9F4_9HELO|nr:hypothetical protein BJ875DRAFT_489446 [Amylocarpus encephaloides]